MEMQSCVMMILILPVMSRYAIPALLLIFVMGLLVKKALVAAVRRASRHRCGVSLCGTLLCQLPGFKGSDSIKGNLHN